MNTCTIKAQQKSQLNWGQYGITHLLWVGAGTAPDLEGGAVFFPDVGTAGASCNRNVIVLSIVPILLGQAGVADGGRKCERRAGIGQVGDRVSPTMSTALDPVRPAGIAWSNRGKSWHRSF